MTEDDLTKHETNENIYCFAASNDEENYYHHPSLQNVAFTSFFIEFVEIILQFIKDM